MSTTRCLAWLRGDRRLIGGWRLRIDRLDACIQHKFGPHAGGELLKQNGVIARQLLDFGVGLIVILRPVNDTDLVLSGFADIGNRSDVADCKSAFWLWVHIACANCVHGTGYLRSLVARKMFKPSHRQPILCGSAQEGVIIDADYVAIVIFPKLPKLNVANNVMLRIKFSALHWRTIAQG